MKKATEASRDLGVNVGSSLRPKGEDSRSLRAPPDEKPWLLETGKDRKKF